MLTKLCRSKLGGPVIMPHRVVAHSLRRHKQELITRLDSRTLRLVNVLGLRPCL